MQANACLAIAHLGRRDLQRTVQGDGQDRPAQANRLGVALHVALLPCQLCDVGGQLYNIPAGLMIPSRCDKQAAAQHCRQWQVDTCIQGRALRPAAQLISSSSHHFDE